MTSLRTRCGAHLGGMLLALGLVACAAPGQPRTGSAMVTPTARHAPRPLPLVSRADAQWLSRVDFGVDPRSLSEFARLGRAAYLERQLHPQGEALPAAVSAQIDALPLSSLDDLATLRQVRLRQLAIRGMTDPTAKQQARRALFASGSALAREAAERELLRAVYSDAQLREQMVWFWLNHFSVDRNKGIVRWLVGSYAQQAIRPHALGHFRDLVMATLESPAMLEYLDNARSSAGHINENYAREFLELHTLGVGSGYTQKDVQELARVFTGLGIDLAPVWRRERPGSIRSGVFEFNIARHDTGPVTLLGQRLAGGGFDEVERAVTLIVRQRACATFISRQLATYFVSDDPPAPLVQAMARTFQSSDGDIAAVLRTMFLSPDFDAALGGKLKDPMRYVVSSVRLASGGKAIANPAPLLNWVTYLGEAPFARQTPDGYPLTSADWDSPGQVSHRFEVARAIGGGAARLYAHPAAPGAALELPQRRWPQHPSALSTDPVYEATLAPYLAVATRRALAQARSPAEWNTLLLASPELNYE